MRFGWVANIGRRLQAGVLLVAMVTTAASGCVRAKPRTSSESSAPATITGSAEAPTRELYETPATAATPAHVAASEALEASYTVQRGDTLYSIAAAHGTSAAALCARNGLTDADALREGQILFLPGDDGARTVPHTVLAGDTLASLARRYGTTASAIEDANPTLRDPERLAIGRVLQIPAGSAPAGRTHTVRRGETLYRIAQEYGVTVQSIATANGLGDASQLPVGLVLVVP